MVEAELAMYGLVADRVVAGHRRRRCQRRDVPALDVVNTPVAILVKVSNRFSEQVTFHHGAVRVVQVRGHEVVTAGEPDDQVRFVEGLVSRLAAPVAGGGTEGTDRVVRVAPRIAGQDCGGAPQAVGVSGQTPAQCEQDRRPGEQQVGAESPRGVVAAAGQQLPVHRAAMEPRLPGIELQLDRVRGAEVVVIVPGRFVRGIEIQGQECVGFRGQTPPGGLKRRRANAPARALQRCRVDQQGLAAVETEWMLDRSAHAGGGVRISATVRGAA